MDESGIATPANDNAPELPKLVICADAVAALGYRPPRSVDTVIADPPYSDHVHYNARAGVSAERGRGASIRRSLQFQPITIAQIAIMARLISHVVRRWVLIFSDCEGAGHWRDALKVAGLEYVRTAVWVKPNCPPQFSGDRPAAAFEEIVIAHQRQENGKAARKHWNGGGERGIYTFPIVERSGRMHPAQKPLPLMEALVRHYSDVRETIMDPYAGSGTTGVAAVVLGRGFVGCEQDPHWHAVASRRLRFAREQLNLAFTSRPRRKPRQEKIAL